MNYLSVIALVCLAAVLVNASESGYYVPKGYYVIHADGHQSELSKISPSHELLLHRLRRRRSAQFASSSSSSSSVSSNGGPVSFHQSSSSISSPGGFPSQGFYPAVFGSINNRFNGDDYDDYYDNGPVPLNNNRPAYSSSQIQTGTISGNGFTSTQTQTGNGFPNRINIQSSGGGGGGSTITVSGNGFNGPTFTSSQTQTGNPFPNRINLQSSGGGGRGGGGGYNNGNTFVSQTSSVSHPSPNGNIVFTQSNNNGMHTETSGIVYPNGQVQITSHKTGKF